MAEKKQDSKTQKYTSITIPTDLFNQIKAVADKQYITVTSYIKKTMAEVLKNEELKGG